MNMHRCLPAVAIIASACLAGCATSYGPNGITGGYKEDKVDDQTYAVYFFGNGHTSEDTVWNYWIYRCAELTKEKGFTAFTLSPIPKKAAATAPATRFVDERHDDDDQPRFVKTKGGAAPTYYYVPGGTHTQYSARAMVTMYKSPYPTTVKFLLDADKVMAPLKPYIESGGKASTPSRKEVFEGAVVEPATPI